MSVDNISQAIALGSGPLVGYPEVCVHQLIERQSKLRPQSDALFDERSSVSLGDLNKQANVWAHRLQEDGVHPGDFVGLFLDHSIESAVLVLAILKIGGVYVPMDVRLPDRRLKEIVEDSSLRLILTDSNLMDRLPPGPRVLCVEEGFWFHDGRAPSNPRCTVSLDDPAYVIYTSGSTGKPKGIVSIHRSMVNRLASVPLLDIQEGDICCLNTPLSFGISASRLFLPLLLAAAVAIPERECLRNSERLVDFLSRHGVTSLFLVPSLLRRLLTVIDRQGRELRHLRAIAVGGEPLSPDLISSVGALLPRVVVTQLYGSAEIGTTAVMKAIDTNNPSSARLIGRPVANTQVRILDANLGITPFGSDGELFVGAAHLGRGYLNRPDLTAKRFVPNTFDPTYGPWLFRTGDRARYGSDGEIELLGRTDGQVKVRGCRVELNEVEALVRSHDRVLDAAVIFVAELAEPEIVAYVVCERLSGDDLIKYLASRLPAYMIPSRVLVLDELPLSGSGKVDRQQLERMAFDGNPRTTAV